MHSPAHFHDLRSWMTLFESAPVQEPADALRAVLARTREQAARLQNDLEHRREQDRVASTQVDTALRQSDPQEQAAIYQDYKRKRAIHDRIRSNLNQRSIALSHQIELLRAQLRAEKAKGSLSAVFIKYDSQQTNYQQVYLHKLGQLIDQADATLPSPADDAITRFVGHQHSTNPEQGSVGIMMEKDLEDAYAPSPSAKGQVIRQQLEHAFVPIAAALRTEFGDHVTLYRAEGPVTQTRYTLSFTSTLQVADLFQTTERQIHKRVIPIESLIWITDRANQHEFIVNVGRTSTGDAGS